MFSTTQAPKQIASILGGPVSPDLQTVAQAFIKLQEARYDADYDLDSVWTKFTAQELVQVSRNASDTWLRIHRSHEANVFSLALISAKLFERER